MAKYYLRKPHRHKRDVRLNRDAHLFLGKRQPHSVFDPLQNYSLQQCCVQKKEINQPSKFVSILPNSPP
ncbi:hypothetical protein [Bacillus sp. CGMCC 1.16541]|uniref:hypothetical protein n=1 Tax=Bacillus sp. CGMCC 1.16541 TaxID=2185143 RepID=UPI000D739E6E|nr:hypothetical protein [Bacillus sp. CGMCC 1.16541]